MTFHDNPTKLAIAPSLSPQHSHQVAWQRWVAAHTSWAARLRYHQHRNFVFRNEWEPDTSAWWKRQWDDLHTATVLAHRAWMAWSMSMRSLWPAERKEQAQLYAEVATPVWLTALEEAQEAWALVLDLARPARTATEPMCPEDARQLLLRAHRHYTQIIQTTERARHAAEMESSGAVR